MGGGEYAPERLYNLPIVPLSEREKRILEDIEKQLYQEDPAFARGVRKSAPRMDEIRRTKWGIVTFLVGFACLIAFFVTGWVIAGVAAFASMVAGIVLVAGALREIAAGRRSTDPGRREAVAQWLAEWEKRVRQRYKGK